MICTRHVLSALGLVVALSPVACDSDPVTPRFNVVAEDTFSFDVPVTTQTSFHLVGINSAIRVTASGSAAGVSATGTRRVVSDSQADADRRLLDLEVRSTVAQNDILIETVQPAETDGRNYVVEYEITVPASLVVDIRNLNGEIEARSVEGDLFINNTNGNVLVRTLRGNAEIILVNGNIEADAVLAGADTLSMVITNGNVLLEIPADTSAEFFGMSVNGLVSLEGITLHDPVQTQETLSGRLGAGEGSINLRTVNGNVILSELLNPSS